MEIPQKTAGRAAIHICTDGSTDDQAAAASCVISSPLFGKIKLGFLIGPMQGAQVELISGVLALNALKAIWPLKSVDLLWTTDNRSIQELAEKYLEQQQTPDDVLWSTWYALARECHTRVRWTRAHAGHKQNEACDKACRWIRRKGDLMLRNSGEGPIGLSAKQAQGQSWYLFDARGADISLAPSLLETLAGMRARIESQRENFVASSR